MIQKHLKNISTHELESEIGRRAQQLALLKKNRNRLLRKLETLDAEIKVLAGSAELRALRAKISEGARKRPYNSMKLEEALVKTLRNRTMTVRDAVEAVIAGGYRTTASSFRTIVNQTLIESERFERVSRGRYRVKRASQNSSTTSARSKAGSRSKRSTRT